jgi:hypothetical protein
LGGEGEWDVLNNLIIIWHLQNIVKCPEDHRVKDMIIALKEA